MKRISLRPFSYFLKKEKSPAKGRSKEKKMRRVYAVACIAPFSRGAKTPSQEWGSKSTRELENQPTGSKKQGDMRTPIAQRLISNEIRMIHEGKGYIAKYKILQERLGPGLARIHICFYFVGFALVWALLDQYWKRRGHTFHNLVGKYMWPDQEAFVGKIEQWKVVINFVVALCLNEMLDLVRLTMLFQFKFLKLR